MDNRRRTIVINKPFQYQYSLLIAALTVLAINSFIILRMLFPGDEPLVLSRQFVVGLAIVELALVSGIWYFSLKMTHRIAGPVFVFTREMARLGAGDLTAHIQLRERDMFQSEAEDMNASIAALRNRVIAAQHIVARLKQAQAEGTDTRGLTDELHVALGAFNTGEEG